MAKKYYVVWSGRKTGIFTTWDECKSQVNGVPGARFKSYPTEAEAKQAFAAGGSGSSSSSGIRKVQKRSGEKVKSATYIEDSICVDAACSGNPGLMEYQGVCTKTGEQLFHFGPIDHGTNNIGEFLAIVHGLAMLKKKNSDMTIYSDSQIAIGWVRKKQMNTTIARNASTEQLWQVIDRAVQWLQNNSYNNPIIKWETADWGEIKADFGRK